MMAIRNFRGQDYGVDLTIEGHSAKGILRFDVSGLIVAEITFDDWKLDFDTENTVSAQGVTHTRESISLVGGRLQEGRRQMFSYIEGFRKPIAIHTFVFEYLLVGEFCADPNSEIFSHAYLNFNSNFGAISLQDGDEHQSKEDSIELESGATIQIIATLYPSENKAIVGFMISMNSPVSYQEMHNNYIQPIRNFVNLLHAGIPQVNNHSLMINGNGQPHTRTLHVIEGLQKNEGQNSFLDNFSYLTYDKIRIEEFRTFIENYDSIREDCKRFIKILSKNKDDVDNSLRSLLRELDRFYKHHRINDQDCTYRGKVKAICSSNSKQMLVIFDDFTLFSKRVKSYRTYFFHDSDEVYMDRDTKSEKVFIAKSVILLLKLDILRRAKISSELRKSFAESNRRLWGNEVKSALGIGNIPMDNGLDK